MGLKFQLFRIQNYFCEGAAYIMHDVTLFYFIYVLSEPAYFVAGAVLIATISFSRIALVCGVRHLTLVDWFAFLHVAVIWKTRRSSSVSILYTAATVLLHPNFLTACYVTVSTSCL